MFRIASICLLWLIAWAAPAAAASVPAIAVRPDAGTGSIHAHLRYVNIAPGTPVGAHLIDAMRPLDHASVQFGKVGDTAIVALRMRNVGTAQGDWFLSTGRGSVDLLRIYRLESGQPRLVVDSGDSAMLGRSLRDYQSIATQVQLRPGEEATFLIEFRDSISSWMPLTLEPYSQFFADRRANISLTTAVVFGSVVLVLITVLVFVVTGRPEFLWLGAAEAAFALNTVHAEGYMTIFALYRWPQVAAVFGELTRTAFWLLMLQFGRVLLRTRRTDPRLDRALLGLLGVGWAIIALTLVQAVHPVMPMMLLRTIGWLGLLAAALTLPVLGLIATRRNRVHLPLLIGWSVVAAYIVYMTLAISGRFPDLPVVWHWLGPVGFFECLMATVTLALHLRQLYLGRISAERAAREALLEKLALSEETARLADERARALGEVRSRDRLLEGSAHDTRHVLHALNSAVHYGKAPGTAFDASPELMALIESSARHLEEIIASSVSVGNRSGRFLALAAIDMGAVMDGLRAIYEPIALRDGIALSLRCAPAMQGLVDEALFARLASNLLNNALKFTHAGSLEIECSNEDGLLRLAVRDSGSGMAGTIRDWLNETAGTTLAAPDGIALGTGWRAIREIVALMRGTYTIEADERGTLVEVLLPNPIWRGATPASEAELARLLPGVRLVDSAALDTFDGDGPAVVIADRADAATRERAAAIATLLLVRPLAREMAMHRYVEELAEAASSPLARASSTS